MLGYPHWARVGQWDIVYWDTFSHISVLELKAISKRLLALHTYISGKNNNNHIARWFHVCVLHKQPEWHLLFYALPPLCTNLEMGHWVICNNATIHKIHIARTNNQLMDQNLEPVTCAFQRVFKYLFNLVQGGLLSTYLRVHLATLAFFQIHIMGRSLFAEGNLNYS